MVPVDDGASAAPMDRAVLERMRSRLLGIRPVAAAEIDTGGKPYLRVELAGEYYPHAISARLEIRWYRNDDFTIHYRDGEGDGAWECRWDRHPNVHNSSDHFHPPPSAHRTEAQDAQWPNDHRDVCQLVFDFLEERIETLWEK